MKVCVYENFPDCAKEIRKEVFMKEQGFQQEFDETDDIAAHIVLFDADHMPAATCRIFWDPKMNSHILGRLAVVKKRRGQNIGSAVVKEAEQYVREQGGSTLLLHAQCRAADFYRKLGFTEYGSIENDEGCPHIWMRKTV